MKNVILHIGIHKTGSSSIQKSLFNSRQLLNQNDWGYFCEDFDGTEKPLPQKWVDLDNFKKPRIKDISRFNRIINTHVESNIIISIEALAWFMSKQSIETVRESLGNHNITVIMYLRRQDQQMVSYHQEGSKNIRKPSTCYYGPSIKAIPNTSRTEYLDYYKRASLWAEVFGKENIIVKIFDPKNFINNDVVHDFCSTVGAPEVESIKVNESLCFEACKVGHLINLSGFKNIQLGAKIRHNLKPLSNNKMSPPRETAKSFYSQFISSNRKLNREFGITDRTESIFYEDFNEYNIDGNEKWDENSANQSIISILCTTDSYLKDQRNNHVDFLRDEALAIEGQSLELAYRLMKRAHSLRPSGSLITKKIDEYEKKLKGTDLNN